MIAEWLALLRRLIRWRIDTLQTAATILTGLAIGVLAGAVVYAAVIQ